MMEYYFKSGELYNSPTMTLKIRNLKLEIRKSGGFS